MIWSPEVDFRNHHTYEINRPLFLAMVMKNHKIEKWGVPFLVVFIIRLITVLYFNYISSLQNAVSEVGYFYSLDEDTMEYILPWENLARQGIYSLDGVSPYAGRSPFVGLPYFIFWLLFGKRVAFELVALLQILLSSIATVAVALLAKKIYENKLKGKIISSSSVFWGVIIFSSLSTYISFYDSAILSDSVSNSSLCLFLFYYYRYLSGSPSNKNLLLSGIFLAMSSLWRPYFVLLYLPAIIGICFYHYKKAMKNLLFLIKHLISRELTSKILTFVIPLLLMDTPWIIRNILTFREPIIFYQTKSFFTPDHSDAYVAYARFVNNMGESSLYWNTSSFACYFHPHTRPINCKFDLSSMDLGPNLTKEKIEKARLLFKYHLENRKDLLAEKILINYFDYLYECYKQDHPLTYWIIPYPKKVRNFIVHSGAEHFPMARTSNFYNPLIYYGTKIPIAGMYWLMLILGFIGCFYVYRIDKKAFMVCIIPFFLIIFICFVAKFDEYRYFLQAYQPMILCLNIFLVSLISKIIEKSGKYVKNFDFNTQKSIFLKKKLIMQNYLIWFIIEAIYYEVKEI